MTALEERLEKMRGYAEYEELLDVHGLAYEFSKFVSEALAIEADLGRHRAPAEKVSEKDGNVSCG